MANLNLAFKCEYHIATSGEIKIHTIYFDNKKGMGLHPVYGQYSNWVPEPRKFEGSMLCDVKVNDMTGGVDIQYTDERPTSDDLGNPNAPDTYLNSMYDLIEDYIFDYFESNYREYFVERENFRRVDGITAENIAIVDSNTVAETKKKGFFGGIF